MNPWNEYWKNKTQTMRPYVPGEDLSGVSVWPGDTPEIGGMIAISNVNPNDQYYVAKQFFEKNYEPAVLLTGQNRDCSDSNHGFRPRKSSTGRSTESQF
jgi:hypothetical protein